MLHCVFDNVIIISCLVVILICCYVDLLIGY